MSTLLLGSLFYPLGSNLELKGVQNEAKMIPGNKVDNRLGVYLAPWTTFHGFGINLSSTFGQLGPMAPLGRPFGDLGVCSGFGSPTSVTFGFL